MSNISLPKSQAKWASRLKCNAYHYRSNYLLIAAAALALTLLRNPLALLAALFTLMGLLCLNDPFALALNANIMKLVRLAHPATANRMKNYAAPAAALAGSRRSRPKYRIAALPRHLFITLLDALALLLLWRGAALLSLLLALLLALGLPLAHASLRAPNLKARLNSARQVRWLCKASVFVPPAAKQRDSCDYIA